MTEPNTKLNNIIYESKKTKIILREIEAKGKTRKFIIDYDGEKTHYDDCFGKIEYNTGWRTYVFNPSENTIWSSDCLIKIKEFIDYLNLERLLK